MAELTNKQKKDWAHTLFIREQLSLIEIAERVGVSRQSLSKWVKQGKWEEEKTGMTLTREQQVTNLYNQVAEINRLIASRPDGKRFATSSEADVLVKLGSAVRKLETEVGIADIISVCTGIVEWIRPSDLEKAKELTNLFDAYIKDHL